VEELILLHISKKAKNKKEWYGRNHKTKKNIHKKNKTRNGSKKREDI
jgi:hypothetical protein